MKVTAISPGASDPHETALSPHPAQCNPAFTILAHGLLEAGLDATAIPALVSLSPSPRELEMGIRGALAALEASRL
jgi:hypothetical protein